MNGTVPFVVVAELREGVLVDIDNDDVGLETVAHQDFAVFLELFEGLAGLNLEELVVEEVFQILSGGTSHIDVGVLRIAKKENQEKKDGGDDKADDNLLYLFQDFFVHALSIIKQ